jgi:hypothetical protein
MKTQLAILFLALILVFGSASLTLFTGLYAISTEYSTEWADLRSLFAGQAEVHGLIGCSP